MLNGRAAQDRAWRAESESALAAAAQSIVGASVFVLRLAGSIAGHALSAIAVALILLFAAVYLGWVDVGARGTSHRIAELLAELAVKRSISVHAQAVEPPVSRPLDELVAGAGLYASSCEGCHRAPGEARSAIADAFNPSPADLPLTAGRWTRSELFWIVKNGIRLTAMPAWDGIYTDREIWAIAALVSKLPTMSAAHYAELKSQADAAAAHAEAGR